MIKSRLKLLRVVAGDKQNRNLTLQVLAAETGLAYNTVARLSRNTFDRVDTETLSRLCKYFQCSLGELLEYVPDEPGEPG